LTKNSVLCRNAEIHVKSILKSNQYKNLTQPHINATFPEVYTNLYIKLGHGNDSEIRLAMAKVKFFCCPKKVRYIFGPKTILSPCPTENYYFCEYTKVNISGLYILTVYLLSWIWSYFFLILSDFSFFLSDLR
jgi:hypothetical protein